MHRALFLAAPWIIAACAAWLAPEDPMLREWRAEASELRGLEFRQRVPLFWITRDELPELVRFELAEVIESGYAAEYRDAGAAMGWIPRDLDLVDLLVRLNQDQIAGLYSLKRRAMYVLDHGEVPDTPIVIHELVHALQHQHFPRTLELMQALRHNDDVVLALGAAVEGDAMRVMALYRVDAQESLPDEVVRGMRAGFRRDLEAPSGMLAEVPRIVRASLLFPYAAGLDLAERTYRAGGRPAIDRMLLDPPLSALRVRRGDAVHDVEFIRPPVALARQLAGEGCRAGHDNVAGVVGIEALFTDHGAAEAAAALEPSWSGDRFLHLRCPDGDELLWITRWRTAEAASAFAAAYGRISASVAEGAGLAGEPVARPLGTSTIVATPDLIGSAGELLRAAEVRRYPDLDAWIRDDCFPESPCPRARAGDSG